MLRASVCILAHTWYKSNAPNTAGHISSSTRISMKSSRLLHAVRGYVATCSASHVMDWFYHEIRGRFKRCWKEQNRYRFVDWIIKDRPSHKEPEVWLRPTFLLWACATTHFLLMLHFSISVPEKAFFLQECTSNIFARLTMVRNIRDGTGRDCFDMFGAKKRRDGTGR